jgi:hypothetical protein
MNAIVRRALRALTLICAAARATAGQDSTVASPRTLAPDVQRLVPFVRDYDIVVQSPDSTFVIGQRRVSLQRVTYAGSPAWVIVEIRTGIAPAVESLFVTPAFRPIHWSATTGAARLGAQFVRDSMYGVSSSPVARQNIIIPTRGDLLVSGGMAESLIPLLPLAVGWTDSAAVLTVDPTSAAIVPAQLTVLAEEPLAMGSSTARDTWVVALRTEPRYVLFWVDRESGAIARVQQLVRGGVFLEYRLRPGAAQPP